MKITVRAVQQIFLLALSQSLLLPSVTYADISPEEKLAIAKEAYLFLYPLVTMDVTRKQMINMDPAKSIAGSPLNTWAHVRQFPPAEMRVVVRPNFDTLYSSAWLDLSKGPVIVSAADTGGRYYLLPMLDMWTDVFAVPGKRTSGTGAGNFAVVPPGWRGKLPKNVSHIDAPTPFVWVIGRTQTNGPGDYEAVHKVQDGYKITLLADWGKKPRKIKHKIDPNVDTKTEPLKQVNNMSAVDFFKYGAELMKLHPPHLSDWSILERMKLIGLEPGKSFDVNKTDPAMLTNAAETSLKLMREKRPTMDPVINGWRMTLNTGVFGNAYLKRAITAMGGLGANQPEDAIYPSNNADADGKPLTADNNYVLHFNKDEIPPVNAFWSLTMYDEEGFHVANPINRFAIGDRDPLKFNGDWSLDLYIQRESPGQDKETNWLPSPKNGIASITLRLYWPKAQALDGTWNPPVVKRLNP